MASVELRRVTKVYSGQSPGRHSVLDQVDLRIEDGELLVLLGPNGSGKTTLLRLIAGLDRVTSGEIILGDEVVTNWSPRRRDVAMVFQSGVLYPHLTVEQNLKFGAQHTEGGVFSWIWSRLTSQRSDEQDHQVQGDQVLLGRVRETAQLLGIESILNRLPRQLSGGERQRVALGRALVRQPAVFLLDEPLANADMKLRQELRVAFRRARQRVPGTMILVSHDHAEALAIGERIAVLGNGKIQQIGPANEVFSAPRNRFVAEFMGREGMSFVEGNWRHENGELYFVSLFGRLALPPAMTAMTNGAERVGLGWRTGAATLRKVDPSTGADPTRVDWTGTVSWVEQTEDGATAYVALRPLVTNEKETKLQETIVMAKGSPPEAVRPGDEVRVELNLSRTFWFDSRTGNNLAVRQ